MSEGEGDNDEMEWRSDGRRHQFHHGSNYSNHNNNKSGHRQDRNIEEEEEPEWMDSSNNNDGADDTFFMDPTGMPAGHSVDDFEKWKAMMRAQELKNAGYDVSEDVTTSNTLSRTTSSTSNATEAISIPKASNTRVDNMFSWMGSQSNPSHSSSQGSSSFTGKASKFSKFFGGPPENSLPERQTSHRQEGEEQQQRQPSGGSSVYSPPPPAVPKDNGSYADKQGFQRIMKMLDGPGHPFPGTTSTALSKDASPLPEPAKPAQNNDAFFLSLLNKGGSHSPEDTPTQPAEQGLPSHPPCREQRSSWSKSQPTTAIEPSPPQPVIPAVPLANKEGPSPQQGAINMARPMYGGYFPGGPPVPPGQHPPPLGHHGQPPSGFPIPGLNGQFLPPPPPGFFVGPGGPGGPGMPLPRMPMMSGPPPGPFPPPPGFPYHIPFPHPNGPFTGQRDEHDR